MNLSKTNTRTRARASEDSSTLMAKVMMLLSGSMIISAIGSYMGQGITSGWVLFFLVILLFAGIFGVAAMAARSAALGVAGLAIWTFINGLVMGPAVNMYVQVLGGGVVTMSFLGTAAVMAALGGYGALSGRDFSAMGRWLFLGLVGLIIVGVIGIFIGMGHTFNLLYAIGGMVIFAGYFIFDFWRIANSENSDYNAVMYTMQVYLDFCNFWFSLLRFLTEVLGKR
ncbi:MAG TPA: Bax inhibitor-1 family protein, partial [Candidatus Obscuribacter sp.]|nr:Bax inhibitor-1 family protein [Candidatus Obscuribacter sp.]